MNQWRTHPKLQGKFLPDYPDDLQIIAHDGGPRITQTAPELVWVSVTAMDGEVFSGRLLNQPPIFAASCKAARSDSWPPPARLTRCWSRRNISRSVKAGT